MMLKSHEILGTDKPVYRTKQDSHFSLEEIIHLNENPEKYKVVAYVQMIKGQKHYYTPVYGL